MRPNGSSSYLTVVWVALFLATAFTVPFQYAMGAVTSRASCGPQDHTESGLQGQTTLAERFKSGPSVSYNCNLELVGHFDGEGAGWHMAEFENCAYYPTVGPDPALVHPGTVVLDVSDSQHPQVTEYLTSPGMLSSNELLTANKTRKLLSGESQNGSIFEIYDLSADCRHPTLKGSVDLAPLALHSGGFAGDGKTFFGVNYPTPPEPNQVTAVALDLTDPSKPHEIARWIRPEAKWQPHGMTVSEDGKRVYLGMLGGAVSPNGVVILDTSEVQARKPNPQIRMISSLFWTDGGGGQFATPVTIKGRPYLVFADINGGQLNGSNDCAQKPGEGIARIIDISDEKNPNTVSKLTLEVHDPANCAKVQNDPVVASGYSGSYCTPDNDHDAKMLACAYIEAGLRVFDIRDPIHPKEIAYYKPPARRTELRQGAFYGPFGAGTYGIRPPPAVNPANRTPRVADHTADSVVYTKFKKNGTEIWFVSFDNAFQVVRFTDSFKAAEKDLFRN